MTERRDTAFQPLDDETRLKRALEHAAEILDEDLGSTQADALRGCGDDFLAGVCLDCGHGSDEPDGIQITCGFRICPECGQERQAELYARYADAIGDVLDDPVRFLTLTVPNVSTLSRDDVDRLKDAWRSFRRRQITRDDLAEVDDGWLWASAQIDRGMSPTWGDVWTAGVYAIEASWNVATGWNLHMHVICQGRYAPQAAISYAWREVTGAQVVDVRNVDRTGDAVAELVKYVAKRPETERSQVTYELAGEKLAELQTATYRMPLIQVWGDAHPNAPGPSITAADDDRDGPVCPECGSDRFYLQISDPELYDIALRVAGNQDRPPPNNADQAALDDDEFEPRREGGDEPGPLYPDGPGRAPYRGGRP